VGMDSNMGQRDARDEAFRVWLRGRMWDIVKCGYISFWGTGFYRFDLV
jgi:hypothetical protein